MTKPLSIVLQLTGLLMIVIGFGSQAYGTVAVGLGLAVIGGVGIRQIKKQERADKEAIRKMMERQQP